jgi:hypothetical protein
MASNKPARGVQKGKQAAGWESQDPLSRVNVANEKAVLVSGSPDMRALLDGILPIKTVWERIAQKADEGVGWALSAWIQYYHGKPHERVDMHNDMSAVLAGQMAVLVALQGGGRLPSAGEGVPRLVEPAQEAEVRQVPAEGQAVMQAEVREEEGSDGDEEEGELKW